ncbi:MAG: hypothetical protein RL885_01060 [Planctomycetota bacterium]
MKAIITTLAIALALSGAHLAAQKAAAEQQDTKVAQDKGREVTLTGELVDLQQYLFEGKKDDAKNDNVVRADTSALGGKGGHTYALVTADKIHILLSSSKPGGKGAGEMISEHSKNPAESDQELQVEVRGRHIEKKGISAILVESITAN